MLERSYAQHDRQTVVTVTRGWLGTPYHDQASRLGVGCDCLGLLRGVFRTLYGHEPQALPPYTRDWAEASGEETLLIAAQSHLLTCSLEDLGEGDVLIFRYRKGVPAKHCAIVSGNGRMIHAVEGAPVAEVPLSGWWRRRIAGAFRFPGTVM